MLHRDGPSALVLDYKTNSLAEAEPEEIVEADYRLQRLVYALACFRAGAEQVEVVYHFLERPDAVVSTSFVREDVPALETELSAAIARIQAGEFRPTPSEFVCADCPALNVVCAGPRSDAPAASGGADGPQLRRRGAAAGRAEARADHPDHRAARWPSIPDATIALRFRSDLELLVSVMLSAQTTDVNVNRVTERLFEKYRRPEDYLAVPVEELEHDIRSTGFFRQKAKAIRGTMQMLIEEYDGQVPASSRSCSASQASRGRRRTSSSAERGEAAGDRRRHPRAPALAAARPDQAGRPGQDRARPDAARAAADWNVFPHLLIWHGRRVCLARSPRCENCVAERLCPASRVEVDTLASQSGA